MLRALGVNIADSTGKMRPFKDLILDIAGAFERLSPQDQVYAGRALGFDDKGIALLQKGRSELKLLQDEMYQASHVTDDSTKRAQEAQKSWGAFKSSLQGVGDELFNSMTPALKEVTSDLDKMGSWLRTHRTDVENFFSSLVSGTEKAAQKLGDFYTKLTNKISASPAGDVIGNVTAHLLAALGSEDAQDTLNSVAASSGNVNGGRSMADYVANYFQSKGWSREQAVGIASNLSIESGFNPSAVGDNGKAYGLAQWHPDRQAGFRAFAGKDIRSSSLDEQLAFIHYELTQGQEKGAGDALRKARSAYEAGSIVSSQYERPARADIEASRRGMLAQSIYGNTVGDQFQMTAEERLALQRDQMGVRPGEMRIGAGANLAPSQVSTTTSEVNIQQMTVNTQATDAPGIARDMGEALRQNQLINSSATGMN